MIAAVATQGKQFSSYMQTYKIGFSDDGKSWKVYKEGNKDKVSYNIKLFFEYQN